MAKDFIGEEATGVFIGELLEDMIDTVSRTHKLYCDVYIPQFYAKDYGHPLTYVPFWALSLPLKKGDKVLVEFHQNDLTLPVLYKNESMKDFDIEKMYSKFNLGNNVTGGNIELPEAVKTTSAQWIGEDSYIIKTDNYTVIHQGAGFILIDKNNNVYVYGSSVNIVSNGDVNIDAAQGTKIFSTAAVEVETKSTATISAAGGFTVNNHLQIVGNV